MESKSTELVRAQLAERGLGDKFCLVPFTSLILEPDGQVGCCRLKGSDFPVGNIREQSLAEIWNGEFLRTWRREFLTNKPQICEKNIRYASCNLCPDYNSMLPGVEPGEYQTRPFRRLGINLNGQCNLRCRMCVVWRKPNGFYDQMGFPDFLEPHIRALEEIELLSGEPFIQKDTYRLIDWAAARNPGCRWTITTNAHWRLNPRVESFLDKIRFKNLIVSIDTLDPLIYRKIRRGGRLETVLANVERLQAYDARRIARGLTSMNMRANFMIQQDNWHEVAKICEFERSSGINCFKTFLFEPIEYSLLNLPQETRSSILTQYENTLEPEQIRGSMRVILPLIDSLPRIDQVPHWERIQRLLRRSVS